PDRSARLEPGLDLRVRRVVLAHGLGGLASDARQEYRQIVPEVARHGLDEIRGGARRHCERLRRRSDRELAAFQVPAGPGRSRSRELAQPRGAGLDEALARVHATAQRTGRPRGAEARERHDLAVWLALRPFRLWEFPPARLQRHARIAAL